MTTKVQVFVDGQPVIRDETPDDLPDAQTLLDVRRARMSLTRREMLIALATEGLISDVEAQASGTTVPAALEPTLATMTAAEALAVRITWGNFTVAYRNDPLVALFAAAATPPLDDAAIDALFEGYAGI